MGARKIARDVAVREREARVIQWRTQGMKWDDVAAREGYANAGGAYKAFIRGMRRIPAQAIDEHRRLQLEVIDAGVSALWPAYTQGKGYAIEKMMMLMDRKARLLGMDAPTRHQVTVSDQMTAEIEALAAELGLEANADEPIVALDDED